MSRLVIVVTSPRVAGGLLSAQAWSACNAGPVCLTEATGDHAVALAAAGVDVHRLDPHLSVDATVAGVRARAHSQETVAVLVGGDRDQDLVAALRDRDGVPDDFATVDIVDGSWDLPGAHLLDVVSTMDRLRSPGGCPWDAEQDHLSLAPYLLEEAYEAFQMIEDGDLRGLRDEIGDVLLQVAFHARLAEELPAGQQWSIDDVADGLVRKLVRRHPHVFADVEVGGASEVNAHWEEIKAAERAGASPLASVPLAAPALTLTATLQRKARRAGIEVLAAVPEDALAAFRALPSVDTAGELLWALAGWMQACGIDPETALRQRARDFRNRALED
ncbi:MAG TPA: MazG family protein [Mycobacteriales bacterium]|nr:MazG family protein [Mycobacteriales bacterium]